MKWTVLFIVHGLGDGLQEQSRVLTNLVGYGNWLLKYVNLLYLKSEIDHSGKGKSITAVLNKVNSLKERRSGKFDVSSIKKFRNINVGNKHRLTSIFSFVRQKFPAEKLMLVVFDHGAGFGIFEPTPDAEQPSIFNNMDDVDNKLLDSKRKRAHQFIVPATTSGFFNKRSHKNEKDLHLALPVAPPKTRREQLVFFRKKLAHTDMLTMEELSGAIKKGFRRKVDVMVMVNCNMQMIETGFSLKDNVDYLVGSESFFWVYGINYREVLFRIDRQPFITPSKVAQLCIETMPFRYERIGKLKNLNDVSFSAIHLEKMRPVYKKLDKLVNDLTTDLKTNLKTIAQARKAGVDLSQFNLTQEEIDEYEPLFFYDLLFFLKNIRGQEERVKEIESLISKAILAKYIGSDFIKKEKSLVHGLSVYFPFTKDDFGLQYFDLFYKEKAKFRIDFAKTNWGKFLLAIKKQAERF